MCVRVFFVFVKRLFSCCDPELLLDVHDERNVKTGDSASVFFKLFFKLSCIFRRCLLSDCFNCDPELFLVAKKTLGRSFLHCPEPFCGNKS